jgi:hypothetical protein
VTAGLRETGWAWADHLRDGGTTPWLTWLDQRPDPADMDAAAPGAGTERGPLPGAAQLELVRRLASRSPAPAGDPAFASLADLALARSGPGRGPARLPLLWPHAPAGRRHGAPPTDPSAVPAEELIRLGVGLLAELLLRSAPSPAPSQPTPPGPRRRLWHKAFHVAGAPVTAAQVRAGLAAGGHVQGGRRPEVVLLAEPLDAVLAQVWSRRVQDGDPVRWATFLRRWARRDALPPAADLAGTARFWADRVGPSRVHVITGPRLRRTAVDVLGLDTAEPAGPPHPRSLSPAAVDLLRRLNRVLGVRVSGEDRPGHLRRAAALLPVTDGSALAVPPRFRGWLDERAAEVTEGLRAGGYAVHGDLARIAPRHGGATHPRRPDVLALVLDTCLRAAEPTT